MTDLAGCAPLVALLAPQHEKMHKEKTLARVDRP